MFGLAAGFGAIWVPSCGAHALVRVDPQTGKIVAQIPAGPADSEGGITTGDGTVWIVTSKEGLLVALIRKPIKQLRKIAIPSVPTCLPSPRAPYGLPRPSAIS